MIILKGLSIAMNGDFTSLKWKFEALIIGGRNGLHGMNSWATEKYVEREIKINDVPL